MSNIPDNPDRMMTRAEFCEALQEATGIKISPATLATKATRGGGPAYVRFGPRAMIRWGTGLEWAKGCLSAPRASTSEADEQARAA
jgi:hypothetical protein